MNTTQSPAEIAKAQLLHAKARIEHILSTTPDDRLHWSPASTARTPLQQVAHAARSVGAIGDLLEGHPEPGTTAEADARFVAWEKQFQTREEVLTLLAANCARYCSLLDSFTSEQLAQNIQFPFGLGEGPRIACLGFAGMHTNDHAAQMEYIQTIYGDRDWHL